MEQPGKYIPLTLEQYWFELHESTYMQIFFDKYRSVPERYFLSRFQHFLSCSFLYCKNAEYNTYNI